jgi:hypothetical protein
MKKKRLWPAKLVESTKENIWSVVTVPILLAIIYALFFNTVSGRYHTERGYVVATFNQPSKYQPPAIVITIELLSGRIVTTTLPQGEVPPAKGQEVTVRISKRQIFGDSFSLVR